MPRAVAAFSAIVMVLGLVASANAQQVIPDLWPVDESKVEKTRADADLELLDLLHAKGVLDDESYNRAAERLAKSRFYGLGPEGALAVGFTPYNQMKYDEVIEYPGSPDEERNFWVNKAELGLHGRVIFPWLTAKMSVEGDSRADGKMGLRVDQAYMRGLYTPEALEKGPFVGSWGMTLGAQKIPFSRQSLKSTTELQFINRSMVVSELPIRYDLGATVHQDYKVLAGADNRQWCRLSIDGGAYNGQGDHVYTSDNNDNMLYAARAQVDLFSPLRGGEGDTMPRWWPAKGVAKSPEEVRPSLSLGASVLQNNDIDRVVKAVGADAEFKWSGLSVQGEYIVTRFEPEFEEDVVADRFAEDWETKGWYVQGGLFVIPRHVELAARYETYELDLLTDAMDTRRLAASTYGINFHAATHHKLKLQLDYTDRAELEGMPELDNNTFSMQGVLNF